MGVGQSKRVLITGAAGFLGKHLSRRLKTSNNVNDNVEVIELKSNLMNFDEVEKEIVSLSKDGGFSACFHFAGISSVPECEANIHQAYAINSTGAVSLAEIIAKNNPGCHFIFPSSGQLYKALTNSSDVLTEESEIETKSTYARSKYLAEIGLSAVGRNLDISVTILRLFNHSHKSQDPRFFIPSIYQQILKAKEENKKEVVLGNIELVRDIGSLHDLLNAFRVLFEIGPKNKVNTYNICSGTGKRLKDIAQEMINRFDQTVSIQVDKSLYRIGEAQNLIGSPDKFMRDYAWVPNGACGIQQLVDSFLADEK
jgi:GDP-4-dehydro-6-deoxy-D-mannose reductase